MKRFNTCIVLRTFPYVMACITIYHVYEIIVRLMCAIVEMENYKHAFDNLM